MTQLKRIQTEPRQRALPPTGAPGALIHPYDPLLTAESRAMGGFFDTISGIALDRLKKIQDQTVHSEFITGKAAWQSRHNEFFAGLAQDEDYENIPNKYNTERQIWQKEIFASAKTRQAQEALKSLIIESDPQVQKVLQEVMVAKHEKKMQGDYLTSLDAFIGAGKFGAAKAATAEAMQKGYIEDEEWLIQKIINKMPELAAAEIDEAKNIDPGRKNQLRSQARTANLRKQAEGLEQLEINREKRRDYISKAIRSGKDAENAIEGKAIIDEKGVVILPDNVGMLKEKEQDSYYDRQRIDLGRRAKGEDSPFRVRGNEEKYADDMTAAILDPASVDPLKVRARMGDKDGYTTDDGIRILTELEDPASALKRSEVRFYVDQINAMDIEAWEKNKMMDDLRDYMRRNPDANPAQLQAFWEKEIEPVVLNWFERWIRPERRGLLPALFGTEAEKLKEKRIESLKEKGLWEELPEKEKRKMQRKPTEEKELSEMTDEELEAIIRGG